MRSATVKQHPASYVPPVDTHPYMVEKPYAQPRYFKRFKDAQALIVRDIKRLMDIWKGLNIKDSVTACGDLLDQARSIDEWSGGSVAGLCDPFTGHWYRASLVRRQSV